MNITWKGKLKSLEENGRRRLSERWDREGKGGYISSVRRTEERTRRLNRNLPCMWGVGGRTSLGHDRDLPLPPLNHLGHGLLSQGTHGETQCDVTGKLKSKA